MISTGSPDQSARPQRSGRRMLIPGVVALVGVIGVIIVGRSAFGVLYSLLFPPVVPLADSMQMIDHTTPAYGTDDWLYTSSQDACELTRFYLSQGAECRIAPEICDTGSALSLRGQAGENVSRCTGEDVLGQATMRYEVSIATGYGTDFPTRVRVIRTLSYLAEQPDSTP